MFERWWVNFGVALVLLCAAAVVGGVVAFVNAEKEEVHTDER